MLIKHMIPRHFVHLDEMTLGVANLSDDVALCDPPRLRASADEVSESSHTSTTAFASIMHIQTRTDCSPLQFVGHLQQLRRRLPVPRGRDYAQALVGQHPREPRAVDALRMPSVDLTAHVHE